MTKRAMSVTRGGRTPISGLNLHDRPSVNRPVSIFLRVHFEH
jgi:hypothetical protein